MKSSIRLTVKVLLLLLICSEFSYSQNIESTASLQSSSDTTFQMTKSPWGAVARSAIIPGWGQFYNESYWKIPVIWGTAAWFVYNWVDNNNLYNDYRSLYQSTQNEYYRRLRNFYRDQRDNFSIYLGLLYLLNLVDAYVDAHLFDFNVDNNFGRNEIQVHLRIKLN
ncbi:MAG: DUF5683 domain-containing protein [Ignavibacterium album]|uniref:DUF5683 domain-containing protein n=1 Tax=Ignavibacterium album TaxID=591197 RepID=UPI0026E9911E|nr:DUF5683 domain-containing protein [Ignavibacterium album]MCX8105329.1 DUF5683 domain-containing protein [Ignavibacterium album]